MIIGVAKETFPGERRVAMVPALVPQLAKAGHEVRVEAGAGAEAGYADDEYRAKGATIVDSRAEALGPADVVLQVRTLGANPEAGTGDVDLVTRDGEAKMVIGNADPLAGENALETLAGTGATVFALEMIPRITRAQSMDVLSSQATIAGYKAVLIAATEHARMFPMSMTAAGTISPARVLVIGAGVAGLQAIATARRLGAVVTGYDVRPVVKEQVESLGAKFLELELDAGDSEDKGGYAKELGEEFYRKQREMMTKAVGESDVVITTAAVPGGKAPVLVTAEMVEGMEPGSVIVDLAAERGGNCELTTPGETAVEHGVRIVGTTNLPATTPFHASQMYAKNAITFLLHVLKVGEGDGDGGGGLDLEDEITVGTLVARAGEVVHPRVRDALGLEPLPEPEPEPAPEPETDDDAAEPEASSGS